MASLMSLTSSVAKLSLGNASSMTMKFGENKLNLLAAAGVQHQQTRSRVFQGFKRNSPEFYYVVREKRHHLPNWQSMKKTRSKRFPGHIDIYDKKSGRREPLDAAVQRFKRLDWGSYVRVAIGRRNKRHQKSQGLQWIAEQHLFAWEPFISKLEMMFTGDLKEKRYFLDDPWEKYNKMSYVRHKSNLLKNSALIKKYGSREYKYDRYKAHLDFAGPQNYLPVEHYCPPGFIGTVNDNGGVYRPSEEEKVTEPDWMAPHCQRDPIYIPEFKEAQRNYSRKLFHLDNREQMLRKSELFSKLLRPWSHLMHRRL